MAEAIMKKLIDDQGLTDKIDADSAGIISYHQGEMADARARRELAEHDIDYIGDARQVADSDFEAQYLIGMTKEHVDELTWQKPKWSSATIHLLMDFAPEGMQKDVPDPYYSDGFDGVYNMLETGCLGLLDHIKEEHGIE